MTGRIQATFEGLRAEGRTGVVAYLTCGFPTPAETPALVDALVEGGADIVELGVPFSDPLADGRTIQKSDQVALEQGVTLSSCISTVATMRAAGLTVPLVLMGYYNPILALGQSAFVDAAAAAGVDGVIVVDLPAEEAGDFRSLCSSRSLDLIFLVAPTTSDERLARTAGLASGFVYCVSLAGTTGARERLPDHLPAFIGRVRAVTDLPLAVGFGIWKPEHFQALRGLADAAVVGSAIIDVVDRADASARCENLREYVEVFSGRRGASIQ
ncbi:MAG: tryptophan synthase subunit alpha [Dehalococcoidia bacterium]|nr:tryptophan synthase subunit alpha [Dehalococcoidia bacterium]